MSKLIMFDFECDDGHIHEDLVPSDTLSIQCPTCSKEATRQISAVRLDWRHMGLDSAFSTCSDKWEKMQRSKPRDENREQNLTMY